MHPLQTVGGARLLRKGPADNCFCERASNFNEGGLDGKGFRQQAVHNSPYRTNTTLAFTFAVVRRCRGSKRKIGRKILTPLISKHK